MSLATSKVGGEGGKGGGKGREEGRAVGVHPSLKFIPHLLPSVSPSFSPLAALTIRTIGVKNVDVHHDLLTRPFPLALFTTHSLRTKHVEALCQESMPELSKKIVCVVDRRILRQSPKTEAFLL